MLAPWLLVVCRPQGLVVVLDVDVVNRHRARMAEGGDVMRKRGALVEHPFGPLKRWAGLDHFRMRGLVTCQGEFNLMILCSNLKRVLNEIKIDAFRAYCRVRQEAQGSRV